MIDIVSIRKLRFKAGITQQELANRCGVSRARINAWERPWCHDIPQARAEQLAEIFNCSVSEVYGADVFKIPVSELKNKEALIKILEGGDNQ